MGCGIRSQTVYRMRLMFDVMSDTRCNAETAMKRVHFEVSETAVTIIAGDEYVKVAKDAVFEARSIIEHKISDDPFFQITYDPYPVSERDDVLIQRMCKASLTANVGPMAAVAGAVATYAVERMRDAGAVYAIVENGGDIALFSDRPVTIGLYSGDSKLNMLSVIIPASENITGVCSSSGKVGPSVSFGNSNISTVFSNDVILADAVATRLGNLTGMMKLSEAVEVAGSLKGVKGCIAYSDGMMAMFGDVPELIKSNVPEDKITKIILQ